jgi:putative ABC transport system ATP-binding protein
MLKLEHISKVYRAADVETSALDDLSLEIRPGEFLAIMGPSGCGKSTLLNILGLIDSPTSGAYWFMGENMAGRSEEQLTLHRRAGVGFVFQNFNLVDDLNVAENVEMGLIYRRVARAERRRRVEAALEMVDLAHRARHMPKQLSGGQQQRVAVARALVSDPKILLAPMGCPAAFRDAVAGVRGVLAASCSSGSALSLDRYGTAFTAPNGTNVSFRTAPLEQGFLELFSVKPSAGRLFRKDRGEDNLLEDDPKSTLNPAIVINESGARALGYSSPQAAVSQYRSWTRVRLDGQRVIFSEATSSQIVGVVPDFSVGSIRDLIEPTVYYIDPGMVSWLVLKLDGRAIPDTLRAVKTLWGQQNWLQQRAPGPFDGIFLNQYVNSLYADIQRQSTIFSVFSAVAVAIGALGLLGLAVFTAERRTREIGLRKVMGASRWDILRFLGWQFARPVLLANLLAWPLAYLLMQRWLEGFAYHIALSPLVFLGASVMALVIALVTVSGHAVLVARARPTEALRYE